MTGDVQRATVRRVSGATVWVTIDRIDPVRQYQASMMQTVAMPGASTASATVAAGDSHVHVLLAAQLAVDDQVYVAFVDGNRDDLIVLGRAGG